MSEEIEASGNQRCWQETARKVHRQLDAMIELMPAMDANEVKTLLETMTSALWLEHQAATLDARNEKVQNIFFSEPQT